MRIDATTFTGSGTIRAQGGTSEGGGGGGGRIAIYYTTHTFTGSVSAFGGGSTNGYGGAQGTVYLRAMDGTLNVRGGLVVLTGTDMVKNIVFGSSGTCASTAPPPSWTPSWCRAARRSSSTRARR